MGKRKRVTVRKREKSGLTEEAHTFSRCSPTHSWDMKEKSFTEGPDTHTYPSSLYGRTRLVSITSTSGKLRPPPPPVSHVKPCEIQTRSLFHISWSHPKHFWSGINFLEHLIINQHLYERTTSSQHLNKHPSVPHFPFPSFPHSFLFPSLSLSRFHGIHWMALFLCSGFVFP